MRFRASLASRVALLATVAVGLSVAFVAVAAYVTVRHELLAALDKSLIERAEGAARTPAVSELTQQNVPSWVFGAADVRIAILMSDGRVITSRGGGTEGLDRLGRPELLVAQGIDRRSVRTVGTDDGLYRIAAVPGNDLGSSLILAQPLAPTYEALNRLGVVLAVFGLIGVVAAGFAGSMVARNGLRPVRRLTEAAEHIARTERLEPIEVTGNDEIARLAGAFNSMLVSLAASRDRQRQLVADAGHELRTPLTSMRTNLELLSQADEQGGLTPAMRTELMDDVRFQIAELTTLIGDLTELARDEPIPAAVEPVDLSEVVGRAVARVRRRAVGVELDVALEPWWVTGEPASLERAAMNLLDNAVKWSPAGGAVTVRLAQGTLYVADEGPGIDEDDLPHVFERFYRSRESRTLPGSGLGLAIVRRIAERHGGAVCAGQAPGGGAAFWFWVPGEPDEPREAGDFAATAQRPFSDDSARAGRLEP